MGERAVEMLESPRGWMACEHATITAAVWLMIGAKLINDGVSALVC